MTATVHFDVLADCTSAITSTNMLKSAISSLAGTSAAPSVTLAGGSNTISQIGQINAGLAGISGPSVLSLQTVGADRASSDLRSLQADAADTSAAISGISGLDVTVGGEAVKRGVQRAGGQPHPAAGQFLGALDDRVTMQRAVQQ